MAAEKPSWALAAVDSGASDNRQSIDRPRSLQYTGIFILQRLAAGCHEETDG